MLQLIYSNETNQENKIGLFNIQHIALESISYLSPECMHDYIDEAILAQYDESMIALVQASIDWVSADDIDEDTTIYVCIPVIRDANSICILDMIKVDSEYASMLIGGVQPTGVSTPTGAKILRMPSTIRIYRAHSYGNESTTIIGTIQEVSFEEYCKIVLQGEFGGATQQEALKAVAVVIRNYAFHRALYRDSLSVGFHVIDHGSDDGGTGYYLDQYYNPTLTPVTKVITAVDTTRNMLVLDSSNKLIPTGYYAGGLNAGGQYSGRLRQNGATYLAQNGYSYEQIIHYFYDKLGDTASYYNSEVADGEVSLHQHTLTYTPLKATLHHIECETCGNYQPEAHKWYVDFESGKERCMYCGWEK